MNDTNPNNTILTTIKSTPIFSKYPLTRVGRRAYNLKLTNTLKSMGYSASEAHNIRGEVVAELMEDSWAEWDEEG